MARRHGRGRVAIKSCQGFVLYHVSTAEAAELRKADELGYAQLSDGSLQRTGYQSAREESPSVITPSETRMNVGESGEPKPLYLRRDGYIDPVEEARNKIQAWPEVGDVKKEVTFIMCPWPRPAYTTFAP
jgi:hypothetical protein